MGASPEGTALEIGGNVWGSNPPRTREAPDTGFEGPGAHQDPFAPIHSFPMRRQHRPRRWTHATQFWAHPASAKTHGGSHAHAARASRYAQREQRVGHQPGLAASPGELALPTILAMYFTLL